ncbi:MAG: DUF1501 domain-containing protein [Planctomycetota bacterium]
MSDQTARDFSCQEYAEFSRRGLLNRIVPAAAAALATQWLPKVALARGGGSNRSVLVHIFLRGGMDGLSTCVPYADADLYAARPHLAVPPPGSPDGAIDLDGFFGLHPSALSLMTPWNDGKLAFVHAAGSTDPTRSHFDAYKFMEYGIPGQPTSTVTTGWLARHTQVIGSSTTAVCLAVESSLTGSFTLKGADRGLTIDDFDAFAFPGNPASKDQRRTVLLKSYTGAKDPLGSAAENTFATIDLFEQIDFANYVPANGAVYPDTYLGRQLKQIAALIKADVGVEVAMANIGGWDLHASLNGNMGILLDDLARCMEAFYQDTLALQDRIVVVAMSEFGRRVAENASSGVDHGHGNCMLLMGGAIAGGQVMTVWPGLAPPNLDSGLDLAITTDYRDILGEVLYKLCGDDNLAFVFPNYTPTFRGIVV